MIERWVVELEPPEMEDTKRSRDLQKPRQCVFPGSFATWVLIEHGVAFSAAIVCLNREEQQHLESRRAAASEALTQRRQESTNTLTHLRQALLDEVPT